MPEAATETRQRVFFAIWPTVEEAAALHRLAGTLADCSARVMRADTLHLTLAFVGSCTVDEVLALRAIGRRQVGQPMSLEFDELSLWPKKRIAWAGCSQTPDALRQLVAGLASALGEAGFRLERRPFKAHVTLLRDMRKAVPTMHPVLRWQVSEFVLAHSQLQAGGAQYQLIERFPLYGLKSGASG